MQAHVDVHTNLIDLHRASLSTDHSGDRSFVMLRVPRREQPISKQAIILAGEQYGCVFQ